MSAGRGGLHHVEIWVGDICAAEASWGWLLAGLGYQCSERWPRGQSWRLDQTYIVLEEGPDVADAPHDRLRPGVNHIAFSAGTRSEVDVLVGEAPSHGWTLMFVEQHPFAGGPDTYAAYLEDGAGFEVELVADTVQDTDAPHIVPTRADG